MEGNISTKESVKESLLFVIISMAIVTAISYTAVQLDLGTLGSLKVQGV